jgi:hypothetical protein
MTPNEIITLTAFLTALTKLDTSLPGNIQIQLKDISTNITTNSNNINKLDKIAESYPPLYQIYQQERIIIFKTTGERSKGLEPEPLSNEPTKELTNAAINTFSNPDSVATAKQVVKSNVLERVREFITGKKTNG